MQCVLLRNAPKGEPLGTERLCFKAGTLVHLAVAVLDVAKHRVAQLREMRTDLVGASRNQPDTAERKGTRLTNYRNLCDDLLIALALPRMDAHYVAYYTELQPN